MLKEKIFFGVLLGLSSLPSYAWIMADVKIEHIYVQSLNGAQKSYGHAISIDKPIDASCGSRLYIDPLDKELFSTALAYKLSGTTFHLMYSTGESGVNIAGHLVSTCKLFSIY